MKEEFAEAVRVSPMLTFPRGWRIKIIPCAFTHEGQLMAMRVYRRGNCVSVLGWRDHFEMFELLGGHSSQLTYASYAADPKRLWRDISALAAAGRSGPES